MPRLPIQIKTLALAGLLLLAMLLGKVFTPHIILANTKPSVDFGKAIPSQFDGWKVDPNQPISVPTPELESMLKSLYNQNISRTYMDDQGHHVMLAVAYTQIQTDRTRVHRPEVCYPSQGFELVSQKDEQTLVEGRSLPVRRMVTRRQDRKEYVSYWVMIGDTPVVSTRDEKIRQIKYGLHLEIPDNLLFRVSSTDDSEAEAFRRHDAFIQAMMRNVDPRQLSSLIGQPNAAPRGGV